MTRQQLTPAFRTMASMAVTGAVIKPLLHAYLFEGRWPNVRMELEERKAAREPDDLFHPSTHPLWAERQLYFYLAEPQALVLEPLEYMGSMSVTMGTLLHLFIQACLRDQGVLLGPEQLAAEGIRCDDQGEPILFDPVTGSGGATDGVTEVFVPAYPNFTRQVFEFKTSNQMKLKGVEDLDLEAFKEKWPGYWAQQQEYLRMTGYGLSIVVFLGMGFPWEIREFHIPADPVWQDQMKTKYLRVRSAVEHHQMPLPCCGVGSKESKTCVARRVCPIALTKGPIR